VWTGWGFNLWVGRSWWGEVDNKKRDEKRGERDWGGGEKRREGGVGGRSGR